MVAKTSAVAETRTLNDIHRLVADRRDTGTGYYIIARYYPSDDVEAVGLFLQHGDQLRKGGGARRKNNEKSAMDEQTLLKSIRRAKTQVRRKCLSMCADRLLTLTFRENVQDIDEAWTCFKYFNTLMRWRYTERWQYVVVPEYQQRGAVHFHLAISGYYDVNTVRKLWRRAVGHREGNIDITSPKRAKKNSWNPRRVANYVSKYITKEETTEFNRRRYASGGSIELPEAKTGWLAYGVPVMQVLRELIERVSRYSASFYWVGQGEYPVTYMST
jgi:hypothetical protein